jgi:GDPmannose 4,6-dehydratase
MLGYEIYEIRTIKDEKRIKDPLSKVKVNIGKTTFASNIIDQMLLSGMLEYDLTDEALIIETNKRKFKVEFDASKFRPSDVPILLANIEKIKQIGVEPKKELVDIINDQINYYLDSDHRELILSE